MGRTLLAFVAALAALIASPPAFAQEFPALSGRVVDAADIIPPDVEAQLTAKLEELETQSQRQLVVATIPDLGGYDISDYGYQLGRAWGIGDKERNDGALLIVAPNERKVRIEVGYGLEPVLTDGLSSLIVQQQIIPRFKQGDMPGGIVAGADAIIRQLQLPPEEAKAIAQRANESRSEGGFPVGAIIWIIFILFFFVLPMLRGRRRRRRFGGSVGDIILWEVGSAIARGAMNGGHSSGSWGGGGGSFGGGGGGFSGGGGSFGGGGASGGW